MNCARNWRELLPFYAAGTLDEGSREAVDRHLASCPACREELAFWCEARAVVVAENRALPAPPPTLLEGALTRIRQARVSPLQRAWALLWSQAPLVRREIWPSSALVMAIGCVVALIAGSRGAALIEALAPVVAAAGLALIFGPENDPGLELALSTPTSPRQVLLARLVLIYGYNLLLALAATLALAITLRPGPLGALILGWLAPMTFLSTLALVLSLCIGANHAITAALGLWLARGLAGGIRVDMSSRLGAAFAEALGAYAQVWHSPALLFGLAAALVAAAIWLAGRQEALVARRV